MRLDGGSNAWSTHAPDPLPALTHRQRSGRLPLAAVRPDYELIPVNGGRLTVNGRSAPEPAGDICAVSYRAELRPSYREVLNHLFTRHASVVLRARITGGRSVDDYEAVGLEHTAWALDSATAAAAGLLGHQVREVGGGALVDAVRGDTVGVAEGDIVVAVDGRPVATAIELRSALAGR